METLVQNSEHLILEEKPMLGRVFSYTLVVAGLILVLPNPYRTRMDFLSYAGIVLVLIGLIMQRFLPANVRCRFDKTQGKLKITRIKPLTKGWEETYDLENISKIRIESQANKRNETRYRLALQLDQDNWVPLNEAFTQKDPQVIQALAEKIQSFL